MSPDRTVAATNWQNPIYPSDLRANDAEQVRIQRELRKYSYLYVRKRQSKQEARLLASHHFSWVVMKDQLAQAVAACFLDPYEVRAGKENLFSTDTYPRIFSSRAIATYLCCFWMRTAVRRRSKGRPNRSYATWLVLHLLWQSLSKHFPGYRQQQTLLHYMETEPWNSRGLRALSRATDVLFRETLRFYRVRRGRGEQALDISTFFRRRALHTDFGRFCSATAKRGCDNHMKGLAAHVYAVTDAER